MNFVAISACRLGKLAENSIFEVLHAVTDFTELAMPLLVLFRIIKH